MRTSKLAMLTLFGLPLPVFAALISIHCHGAAFTSLPNLPDDDDKQIVQEQSLAGGQTITSLVLSPAMVVGGKPSTGVVFLRYPAPAEGLVVTLQSSNSAQASIPQRVVIAPGKDSANFSVSTKPVKSHISLNVYATCQNAITTAALMLVPSAKGRWYVSANGSSKGHGTLNSPWDLATALSHGSGAQVKPGDTVWLKAGRYSGTFVSTLNGREDAPIIVRAYPGDRVILDKAAADESKQPALKVKGSYVWFWGIEIMNSSADRRRISPYSGEDEPWRGSGADVYAPNVKFINMIFHDNGHGIWDKQDMTEVHGCLFFYNGNNKREHALYIGNALGTKYITDNIVFDQGGYGILAHSNSSLSSQKGLHLEGNVTFNNGILTNDDQKTGNIQVGGVRGVSAERIVLKNNYVYNPAGNADNKNNGVRLGYEDTRNKDVRLLDNYIASRAPLLLWWWQSVDFLGNTIYSDGEGLELRLPGGVRSSSYRWDFNSYFSEQRNEPIFTSQAAATGFSRWRQMTGLDQHSRASGGRRPTGVRIFVRPNQYEAGRANIVVYNWERRDQVQVDLNAVLPLGSEFEVRDAQNFLAEPLLRGVYNGEPLLLPMRLSAMPLPVGDVERVPRHTGPEFAVFVLQARPVKDSL